MEASVAAAIATIIVGVVTLSVLLMQIKLYDKRRRRDYVSSKGWPPSLTTTPELLPSISKKSWPAWNNTTVF